MSRTERVIATLLLAIAVAGGAVMPRLLSAPSRNFGSGFAPDSGRSVVRLSAIPLPVRHAPAPPVAQPAEATARPVAPVVPAAVPPSQSGAAHAGHVRAPRSSRAVTPLEPSSGPSPLAAGPQTPATITPAVKPAHEPPSGHQPEDKPGRRGPGPDVPGSRHGPPPQVPAHPVGARHRHVGRVAKAPARPAAPAPKAGPKARPKAGRPSGKSDPPPAVAHRHGPSGRGKKTD